jgi:hypothetical protein
MNQSGKQTVVMSQLRTARLSGFSAVDSTIRMPSVGVGILAAVADFVTIVVVCISVDYFYHLLVYQKISDVEVGLAIGVMAAIIFVVLAKSMGMIDPQPCPS